MTCSQQPELGLSLNYTDGQRNMWSYYAPNGRRYRQILVEKQCLCGSRLNWTNWEDVTISPERLMGLEWRLTGVKCRASSGCVQIPTGVAAQMQEIWHKVWTKCRGNSGEEWLLRMTCNFDGRGWIAMWDYVWSLVWIVWADPEVWQNVADRVQGEVTKIGEYLHNEKWYCQTDLEVGWMQIWATNPPNIEKIRQGVGEIWHPKRQNSGTTEDNTHTKWTTALQPITQILQSWAWWKAP